MRLSKIAISAHIGERLISMDRISKVGLVLTVDFIALPLCSLIATLLRVGELEAALQYGPAPHLLISAITICVFAVTGLYGAVIRFIDQRLLVIAGTGLGTVIIAGHLLVSAAGLYRGFPSNVLLIYLLIAFMYVVTSRLMARMLVRKSVPSGKPGEEPCTVAIYGAGEAGAKLALAMRSGGKYRPVCFFDDKNSLDNWNVAGLKVYHASRLVDTVAQRRIQLIVIAAPSAAPAQRREMMYRAHRSGAAVKIFAGLMELTDEEVSVKSIREIKLEDLLGRPPIAPHYELFSRCVQGQSVLVTGAGGSIGSELCRQIIRLSPRQLHLLDHCEHSLYQISRELSEKFPDFPVQPHLGSVCDPSIVERVMREGRIETVYHAAAYKHVPLVESNITQGIRNNVFGTQVLAAAADKFRVKTCVLVSTDKAVRPTSMMGATKRIAELVFQAAAANPFTQTTFCIVRFGNVLGSSGSVVPLFKSQIERGGPVTVTHKEVIRYFMSIPEAAQLVMQAGAMATGGDVFVMDMGEPVRIVDLARTMIALSGLTEKTPDNPDGQIEIRIVGLRPGEKLYEEPFAGNDAIPSQHPRIMTTTEYMVDPEVLAQQIAYLKVACDTNDKEMVRFLVRNLVDGYQLEYLGRDIEPDDASILSPAPRSFNSHLQHLMDNSAARVP